MFVFRESGFCHFQFKKKEKKCNIEREIERKKTNK